MDHYKLVRPEHLNHHGSLFGGFLLQWIDELAYITANLDFPGNRFVTIALDNVEFRQGVNNGEILKFQVALDRQGTTSVHYRVSVYGTRWRPAPEATVFETRISLVNVDEAGKKQPVNQSEEK